jgi:N-acyl amino acid synthase of PEP-CTERM/exosortase system
MESLVENFSRYFVPRYAVSYHEKRHSYCIRYKVYVEELGWEPHNTNRLETDHFDAYAHPCLLEHKRTGDIAGCVRLVVPESNLPESHLPYQTHPIKKINTHRLNQCSTLKVGEISRLAVPSLFRRRHNEQGKPFVLNEQSTSTIYTKEELRNFPNIAIGLYLSAIAMVALCELEMVVVVMEPRLQRHLKRFGLSFYQISNTFDMKGQRALFELPVNELTCHMSPQILELYEMIRDTLAEQAWHEEKSSLPSY